MAAARHIPHRRLVLGAGNRAAGMGARTPHLLNEVWAPTRFIHRAFEPNHADPRRTPMLPGMLPPVAPANMPRTHFGLDPSKFLFLFLFDMNSVMERKNPLATVAAFRQAFGGSRDVQLAIKVSRGDADPQNFARLQQACDEAGCVLIDRVLSREESYGLLNACDAYVSLHRSEGFGLTMAEAMFFGKPVIATGYSGNLDFMSADNSLLIPYEMTPLTLDYTVYRKGSRLGRAVGCGGGRGDAARRGSLRLDAGAWRAGAAGRFGNPIAGGVRPADARPAGATAAEGVCARNGGVSTPHVIRSLA